MFYYARPKNPGDFNRMAGRKMLVMMIDSFNGINGNIDVVRAIKERAGNEAAPIIFFTQDRDALILEYNRRLKFYQSLIVTLNFQISIRRRFSIESIVCNDYEYWSQKPQVPCKHGDWLACSESNVNASAID